MSRKLHVRFQNIICDNSSQEENGSGKTSSNPLVLIYSTFFKDDNIKPWKTEALKESINLIKRGQEHNQLYIGWSLFKRGQFEVKSNYKVLSSQALPAFPWKKIWQVKAPSRVVVFGWTSTLGKILTHDNL
jgi:hypothetical protein